MKRGAIAITVAAALALSVAPALGRPYPHVHNGRLDHLDVRVKNDTYHASHRFEIMVGRPVDVENLDGLDHSMTADHGLFDTGVFSSGTATIHAPEEPGDYPFHCTVHPGMTGVLRVLPNP